MACKKILLVFFLGCSLFSSAQNIKSQSTFRMLKTATSLTEAQQFSAAEEYFKKGLQMAKANQDFYCQAFAYEGLGNLYTKSDQPESAIASYKMAVKLYRNQGLTVIADVVESLLKSVQGVGDLYAGIEIGAKGVKLSVIEVKLSKEREYGYTLKADTSINTDAASLSYQSEKETRETLEVLLQLAKNRYQVPASKTFVVVSSGLKQELDRFEKVDYFTQVIRPASIDPSIKIAYVTPEQESEYSFMGIVPQKYRYNTNQLDIGSGNTKGGYFSGNKVFVPVTLSLGTKSFQRLVETKSQGDLKEFMETARQMMRDSLTRIISNSFASKRDFKSRDIMYLSGGIVWSIASLMHPQFINSNYVEITGRDIADFRNLIFSSYDEITNPDITLISNAEDARASLRNINRVLKTYDQKALLAGAIWLDELIQQINSINPGKKFVYPKYAYVGWISGYVIRQVTQQFTGLAN